MLAALHHKLSVASKEFWNPKKLSYVLTGNLLGKDIWGR
jgi:hypothetical protein